MAAHYLGGGAVASGRPEALLLRGDVASPNDEKLAELLRVLGVPARLVHVSEIAIVSDQISKNESRRFCVLASARCMSAAVPNAMMAENALPDWIARAESVYVYGFTEEVGGERLLRVLTGDPCAKLHLLTDGRSPISVSLNLPAVCGAMSGLQFDAQIPEKQPAFQVCIQREALKSILSSNQGHLFISVKRAGAELFLSASTDVIDVSAPCTKYFDVRENLCNTVPIVMYAKWAFGVGDVSEIGACLIVDDPPLKPRYGFMRYQDVLRLMDEHDFATTVAFIPWNWRRTDAHTVKLFHEHPNRLSLCIHGCDHTAKEFAERSTTVLNKRINVASQRMRLFGTRTKLRHDDVMLFPQGAFSASAARALKLNGFVAAANTEVVPVHKDENKTTVGDLFGQAIMKYASFPLFTRRYLAHGVENFAFDGLLGKPCFIAAHHDDFAGDARILLETIAKLNSLNWKLRWRSLGDAIRRSFRVRRLDEGSEFVQMFGTSLRYRNSQGSMESTFFMKEESDLDCVRAVTVNGLAVEYFHQDGHIQFEAVIPPNESAEVRIVYAPGAPLASEEEGINYRAKAVVRRYLSEFRDNYLSRHTQLQHGALRIKEALRL